MNQVSQRANQKTSPVHPALAIGVAQFVAGLDVGNCPEAGLDDIEHFVIRVRHVQLQRQLVDRFDRLLLAALGALALGLALVVAIQVRFGLSPLRRLAQRLEDVRQGRVARLDLAAPREIEALVRAMNEVLDQDAARIERARTHVGNLAHALKTPLAVLTAEAERRGTETPDRIAAQIGEMTRLVDHHLTRAAAAPSSSASADSSALQPGFDARA